MPVSFDKIMQSREEGDDQRLKTLLSINYGHGNQGQSKLTKLALVFDVRVAHDQKNRMKENEDKGDRRVELLYLVLC